MEDLTAFGPYPNAKWKLKIEVNKAVFDDIATWSLHIMEIEMKVPKSEGDVIYQAVSKKLEKLEIRLCGRQEGKTMRLFVSWALLSARMEVRQSKCLIRKTGRLNRSSRHECSGNLLAFFCSVPGGVCLIVFSRSFLGQNPLPGKGRMCG